MSKTRLFLATALLLGLAAAGRAAEAGGEAAKANVDVLVDAIRANRKAVVSVNMRLTDDEASRFWPVYDRYQKEMSALGDRLVAVIGDYSKSFRDLSSEKAMKLVDDYLTIEADRVKVRRSYVDEFAKALPGRKVARFYQLENKMDAVIRYELAADIPVVEDEGGGSSK
jgi:enamine deaminase RidA (YjgF/YER057c/UK114 family)